MVESSAGPLASPASRRPVSCRPHLLIFLIQYSHAGQPLQSVIEEIQPIGNDSDSLLSSNEESSSESDSSEVCRRCVLLGVRAR